MMKINKILYTGSLALALGMSLTSCDSFLDEEPDNRATVDSEDKIVSLLTSAYSNAGYTIVNEVMSDNTDDMGQRYIQYDDRFYRQAFYWTDITESDNDGTLRIWSGCYSAIAAANQALESIEELGGATTLKLKECKAEALMARAYYHFILVNEFCMPYDPATSSTALGIPYSVTPEKTLSPSYTRGNVAEVYAKIEKDILEAIPLLGDTHYSQPKYHFNKQAALAFASRFFLFYQKWELAAKYATDALGSNPKSLLRDWDEMNSYGITNDLDPRNNLFVQSGTKANFFIQTTISMAGYFFSNYGYITKYAHNSCIAENETLEANQVWGPSSRSTLRCPALAFSGGAFDRVLVAKTPKLFEETNAVSQTGYWHSVMVPFRADILLLERAEAYTMLQKYDLACKDLTMWMQNWTKSTAELTPQAIQNYYNSIAYYTSTSPTSKKHLYPSWTIDAEGSVQESMLQCVLNFKRIETVHEGLRWFDVNRYRINITRRVMNQDSECDHVADSLGVNDPRRAIQLPFDVISAGLEKNPR